MLSGNCCTLLRGPISFQRDKRSILNLLYRQRPFYTSLTSPGQTNKFTGDITLHTGQEHILENIKPLKISPISSIQEALFKEKVSHEEGLMRASWPREQESLSSNAAGDFSDLLDISRFASRDGLRLENTILRIKHIRSIINQHLLTHEDGLRFVAAFPAFIRALGCSQIQSTRELILRTFNATLSRLHKLSVPLNSSIIVHGMICASRARSLAALEYYFNLFITNSRALEFNESHDVLSSLWHWIRDVPNDQKDIHVNQKLWRILTGFKDINCPTCDKVRQPCLYKFMKKDELSSWSDYVSIVSRIGGGDGIWNEWRRIKIELPSLVIDKYTNTKQGSQNKLAAGIIDVFATKLLRVKDPIRAWQLVRESGFEPERLSKSTWSVLFDHPEYIDKWEPGMSDLMLQKYEERIESIEQYLGIQWSGGENGCHLLSERDAVKE